MLFRSAVDGHQAITQGRNAAELSSDEYLKELLEANKDIVDGVEVFTSKNVVVTDLVVGSLLKQLRDTGIAGREIADEHMKKCMMAGLKISGINAEVMVGQWEYQIGPVDAVNGSDQLVMSRYILERVAECESISLDRAASLDAISSILADSSALFPESPKILANSTALSLS